MRTWRMEPGCYICHVNEGDKYDFEVESTGEKPADNWEKPISVPVKLIEITRDFSKEDKCVLHVCSRCMLLLMADEIRTSYRYGFRLPEPPKTEA